MGRCTIVEVDEDSNRRPEVSAIPQAASIRGLGVLIQGNLCNRPSSTRFSTAGEPAWYFP
jgi:hypothetical protein